jgi:hypothetical protein
MKKCDWCGKDVPFSQLKLKGKFYCSQECMDSSK